jgi:hypothetical protein
MIRSGLADPQGAKTALQAEQYGLSVEACLAVAGVFEAGGYDVVIDDSLDPAAYTTYWLPLLADRPHRIAILTAGLDETLDRSTARQKAVYPVHTEQQHAAVAGWDPSLVLDTSGQTEIESLRSLHQFLRRMS